MNDRPWPALAIGLVLGLAGCSERSTTVAPDKAPHLPAGSLESKGPETDPIRLEMIDKEGLAKMLAQHRGQVVMVDFWATWCEPCVELFPHTVQLHKRLGSRGLAVISVSFDEPDNQRAVLKFLSKQGADFQNRIATYGVGSEGFSAFEIPDGALPCLKLYDRQGNLSRTFSSSGKPIRPSEIDRAIEKLL